VLGAETISRPALPPIRRWCRARGISAVLEAKYHLWVRAVVLRVLVSSLGWRYRLQVAATVSKT
jgi:hypothetical protein